MDSGNSKPQSSSSSLPGHHNDDRSSRKRKNKRNLTDRSTGTSAINRDRGNNSSSSNSTASKKRTTTHGDRDSKNRHAPSSDKADITLRWDCPHGPVTIEAEEKLLPLLIQYGEKERGMMKNQHYRRFKSVRDACREHSMTIDQALSLRRTHIMLLNPQARNLSMLGLGSSDDVRQSATLFEDSVSQYLQRQRIPFFSEEEQRAMVKQGDKSPPTPDFLFKKTVHLQSSNNTVRPIKWIEAKMFFGASTIPDGTKNAVGALLGIAKRYMEAHGPGAFVFSFGYGIRIKEALEAQGAILLDAHPLDLRRMREHQRTWCANDGGQILP